MPARRWHLHLPVLTTTCATSAMDASLLLTDL